MAFITKAVILADGKGIRMGALTRELPKAMLRVGLKPLLEHTLDRLQHSGITHAAVVIGSRRD